MTALCIVLGFSSCKKELDEAPALSYDGHANMTIRDLLDTYTNNEIPEGTVITGIVISSDEQGACYKALTIQDETAGIQIPIDNSSLYPKFRPGQRIYVECAGMSVKRYRNNPQLGFDDNGSIARLPSDRVDQYIFRDGAVGTLPEPLVITSTKDLKHNGAYDYNDFNRWVRLDNCYFKNAEQEDTYYSHIETNVNKKGNQIIKMSDGTEIIVRTSQQTAYSGETLAKGTGSIYGIITIYGGDIQLSLLSLKDVHLYRTREEILYTTDFMTNPFEDGGWTKLGTGWNYFNNGQMHRLVARNSTGWAISHALGLSVTQEAVLSIEHTPNCTNGTAKIYYTTTAYNGSEPNIDAWTELYSSSSTDNQISTFTLPANVVNNPHFRIAFHYTDETANQYWMVNKVTVKELIRY